MKPSTLVNKLAEIRAALASLKAQEDALKEQILETGLTEIDSEMFRVTVSHQKGRQSTDWTAVKAELWDNLAFRASVQQNTTEGAGAIVIRLTARKQVAA
jgi:hypothetical protein